MIQAEDEYIYSRQSQSETTLTEYSTVCSENQLDFYAKIGKRQIACMVSVWSPVITLTHYFDDYYFN